MIAAIALAAHMFQLCWQLVMALSLQATVEEWKLGWNFSAGEMLTQAQYIYTPNVNPVKLVNQTVQLQAQSSNTTVEPLAWTYVSFLGNKAAGKPPPGHPYKAWP